MIITFFSKMRIYKITSPNTDLVYVGKTTQELHRRGGRHETAYKAWLAGTRPAWCSSYKVLEHGNASIELIEETDDATREGFWIQEMGACNAKKLDGGEVKKDPQAYSRARYQANREVLLIKCKEYKDAHREELAATQREYREAHRERIRQQHSEKLTCSICGKSSARSNLARHQRSKSCLEAKR